MFQIQGPILAAMDLDKGSDDLLRQADAFARSYNVKLSVCHVLPEAGLKRINFDINHESGLLGISGTGSEMRELIERQTSDVRDVAAAERFYQ